MNEQIRSYKAYNMIITHPVIGSLNRVSIGIDTVLIVQKIVGNIFYSHMHSLNVIKDHATDLITLII